MSGRRLERELCQSELPAIIAATCVEAVREEGKRGGVGRGEEERLQFQW
jgi:hypothetical protein